MSDQQVPEQYPHPGGHHDTAILSWPRTDADTRGVQGPSDPQSDSAPGVGAPGWGASTPASPGSGGYGTDAFPGNAGGQPGPVGWVPAGASANPDAAYWESRFRRQRVWTRFLGATIVAGVLLVVGGGLLVWNFALPRAADSLSQELDDALPGLGLPDSEGAVSAPGSPDVPLGGDGDDRAPAPQDLSTIPLPDQLQGLGSMLGIDNMDQLLDTAVSMGLMSQEQADQIREVVGAGGSLEGLLGSGGVESSGADSDQ